MTRVHRYFDLNTADMWHLLFEGVGEGILGDEVEFGYVHS